MNLKQLKILFVVFTFIAFGCKENNDTTSEAEPEKQEANSVNKGPALFEFIDASETNISFVNTVEETENFNILTYEYLYNGGGVAVGDINNDGLDDIYFSGNMVSNKLYLNQGNFKFKDITNTAKVGNQEGYKTGVCMVDINKDGLLDLYVCRSANASADLRKNLLYINNGDLTFTERASEYGLDDSGYSVQAYFFDSDNDNDLDAYVLNHPKNLKEANSLKLTRDDKGNLVPAKLADYTNLSNRLYVNNNSKFEDISEKAGVLNDAFSLSAVIGDFNNDNRPDIYVCNDYVKADRLLINQGNNVFEDEIDSYLSHTAFSAMGSDFADINNDGLQDLITLDMSPFKNKRRKMMMMMQNYDKFEKMVKYQYGTQYASNTLQLNNGNGTFSDISLIDNVAQTEWSWSALLADFDNDGYKDIHITNGYRRDVTNNDYARYGMDALQKRLNANEINLTEWTEEIPSIKVPAFLFKNQGGNQFKDMSQIWDSGQAEFSNGAAYGDFNNDGYLDIVVNNINSAPFVMKNNGKTQLSNDFVSINFSSETNILTTGTKAKLTLSNGEVLTEVLNPTRGFLSSSQYRLHFGIPKDTEIEKIEIIWPNLKSQTITNPELNQRISVVYKPTSDYSTDKMETVYFENNSTLLGSGFTHKENDFIDFKREPLLHRKFSEEGPAVAIADVNGDGLDDIYFGGAMNNRGKLFLQTTSGKFTEKTVLDFEVDKNYEDTDAIFFDSNNDGNLDLYVVSGGNESSLNSQNYQDRLYLGDGNGNFIRIRNVIPNNFDSGSVVKVHDIDGDGFSDIFVGSRVVPGRYPEAPTSRILKNENGVFKDVSNTWGKAIKNIGMVTDAEFEDLDNDGILELIIAGEWMPVSIFKFENNTYTNKTDAFGIDDKIGWWNGITIADVNGDGFKDILAGNLGLNSIFKASTSEPVELYYKDFDNNGSLDAVITNYNNGVSYPLHSRDRMLDQMVMLKKRFTRYEPYSTATLDDIFTTEELKNVKSLKANHLQHTLFLNDSGKRFNSSNLPSETQISVVNDAVVFDLNADGKMDVVTGGNFYGTDAEYGRYDASIGNTIINQGNGDFKSFPASKSGLKIGGNVQHIKRINIGEQPHLLVIRNNESASLVRIN